MLWRLLGVLVLLTLIVGPTAWRPPSVAAAGYMTWIDPYCQSDAWGAGAWPGLHWWDYWGGAFGSGSSWTDYNDGGGYYLVDPGAYLYGYGVNQTLNWSRWARRGYGTYRFTLAYEVSDTGTLYRTEYISCWP